MLREGDGASPSQAMFSFLQRVNPRVERVRVIKETRISRFFHEASGFQEASVFQEASGFQGASGFKEPFKRL